ncbi:MAG: hypothetical protein QOF60_2120 [Actinomycetota bacterium]|nr:hypothetical protein [Actinomycetota bacterium]
MDRSRLLPWVVRAAWASLPFVVGPALAASLDGRSVAVRTVASVGLWGVWGLVLCATLVLHPVGLTVLRVLSPAVFAVSWWSASVLAVASSLVVLGLCYLPETGMAFVNGPAYPNERRFPLRPPGALLLGPLLVAEALVVGLPVAAALLLSVRRWVAGGVLVVLAGGAVFVLGRALHGLSRRWVVFVPAGVVLHDPLTLADPVLFSRPMVTFFGPAPADTPALDLTQRSPGLALEISLSEPASLVLTKPGQRIGPTVVADRLLFTPTRPGRVVAEARERRLPGFS